MIMTEEQNVKKQDRRSWHWLAINGPTAARCSFEFNGTPTVSPTPEMLIGFPTGAEAINAQHLCLKAPIEQVKEQMQVWRNSPDVKIVVFKNPEPPTSGSTSWVLQ